MQTLKLNLPNNLEIEQDELLMILASSLYEKSKLSLGQAADLANLSKRTFAESLGSCGVSLFNYSASELEKNIENA